jgi:hypothetical protein
MRRTFTTTQVVCLVCGLLTASSLLAREEARIGFEEAVAVYGPGLYPAITKLARCEDYRVFVVHGNGTDMLFMDRLVPVQNESTFAAEDGMSFSEFNSYEESIQIKDVSCQLLGPARLQITGQAHSFHTEKTFRFTLVVDVAKRSHTYQDTQPK